MMLPNLSESLRKILLSLEKKEDSQGLFSSNTVFLALCERDGTVAKIASTLFIKKISEKSLNLSELVAKSYTEAYKESASVVYPYHTFLALTLWCLPARYKDAFLAQKAIQMAQKDYKPSIFDSDFSPFTNLTYLAATKKLPKIISREKEIDCILSSFLQRDRKPLLLLGPTGVGKTSIAYGLAQKINDWKVPRPFLGAQVLLLDSLRDSFEKGLLALLNTYGKYGVKTILFFDDIHTASISGIVGVSALSLNRDFGLKEDLPINFLGATNDNLASRPWVPSLSDFWEEYPVLELSSSVTCRILREKIKTDAYYKRITVANNVLSKICESTKVSTKVPQVNPGKAVFLLNEAIAKSRVRSERLSSAETATKKKLDLLTRNLNALIVESQFNKSIKVASSVKEETKKIENLFKKDSAKINILLKDIKDILSFQDNKIAKIKRSQAYNNLLVRLENKINEQIVGQERASHALSLAVRRAETAIADRGLRPAGSFLFLGPTGVGKTETAKVLARVLKDAYELTTPNFLRLDMADFMERHTVARLTGSPPGYVGYDEGGQLTEFVLENPQSIILFDEIEKAHPDVLNILLSILEEGELAGGGGEVASFRECIVILTSNIGSELLAHREIGFGQKDPNSPAGEPNLPNRPNLPNYEKLFLEATKKILKPEFLNRLDEIIVFRQLNEADLLKIIDLQLAPVMVSLKQKGIKLTLTDVAKKEILAKGNFKEYGARELRRIIEKEILDPLNIAIFNGRLVRGGIASFGADFRVQYSQWSKER
ncbi:AAA family ATPase [Patescibacteria group bacterium]|nr:AAA family ATPase [Patescibacteria group bacterium]